MTLAALDDIKLDASDLIRRAYDIGRKDGRGDGLTAAAAWMHKHGGDLARDGHPRAGANVVRLAIEMLHGTAQNIEVKA